MERMREASEAAQAGKHAEALDAFLWCFDHGQEADEAFGGVQSSFLIDDILSLSEVYPPALQELVSRRDKYASRLTDGTASLNDAFDFSAINQHLGQEQFSLRIFQMLEPGSKNWQVLGWGIREFLLEHRRYGDLLSIFNPEAEIAEQVQSIEIPACDGDQRFKSHLKDKLVRACAPLVEALAALGEHERARQLADGILRVIRTDRVVSLLVAHAKRSGDVVLTKYLFGRQPKRRKA